MKGTSKAVSETTSSIGQSRRQVFPPKQRQLAKERGKKKKKKDPPVSDVWAGMCKGELAVCRSVCLSVEAQPKLWLQHTVASPAPGAHPGSLECGGESARGCVPAGAPCALSPSHAWSRKPWCKMPAGFSLKLSLCRVLSDPSSNPCIFHLQSKLSLTSFPLASCFVESLANS